MKNKIIIILFLISSCFINAQKQNKEDSLKSIIKQQNGDIKEVDAFSNLIYSSKQIDSALKYAQQGLALAQKISYRKGEADCYFSLGAEYASVDNQSQAIQNYFNALRIYTDIKDVQGILFTRLYLQGSYKETGDYNSALVQALPGVPMAETTHVMATKLGWKESWRFSPTFLAEIGQIYLLKNQPDSALIYIQKAISQNFLLEGATWNFPIYLLGNIQRQKGNYELALAIYRSAIPLAKHNKAFHDTLQIFSGMSTLFKMKGQLDSAIYYAEMVAQSKDPDRETIPLLEAVNNLAEVYKLSRDKDKAIKYIEISHALKDSIYSIKKDREIQNVAFNEQLNQQEIISAQAKYKSKVQLYSLVGGFLVILFIAGILWRNNYNRKKAYALLQRQKKETDFQRGKSDELLLNILPSEVAEELKEKGYTTAKAYEEVTVLFSDIKGFTSVAENMTAQELVKEIDTYFSAFDGIIQKNGLEKIKTIGDAYIAVGGLPEKNSATAQNVIEAAIDMQRTVEKLKQERASSGKPFFELRIGIHTGPVVAGVVGIKKFQYDIWGDTVNLAARMEQSGVPGKINISQHTYEVVKEQFICSHRGKIEAKNKGEIDMYFVEQDKYKNSRVPNNSRNS